MCSRVSKLSRAYIPSFWSQLYRDKPSSCIEDSGATVAGGSAELQELGVEVRMLPGLTTCQYCDSLVPYS